MPSHLTATPSTLSLSRRSQFADLLLINKCDLVTAAQRASVEAFLRKANPTAEIVGTQNR